MYAEKITQLLKRRDDRNPTPSLSKNENKSEILNTDGSNIREKITRQHQKTYQRRNNMEKEKLLEKLKGLDFKKCTTDDGYRALCKLGKEIDVYDFSGRFVRFENLDNIVRTTLDKYGVYGVKAALDGVTNLSHDFYYKDDDGKIRNVNANDLECLRYELKVCIEEL